jgi:hypothetical protein
MVIFKVSYIFPLVFLCADALHRKNDVALIESKNEQELSLFDRPQPPFRVTKALFALLHISKTDRSWFARVVIE